MFSYLSSPWMDSETASRLPVSNRRMMIERMWRYCSLEHFHRTTGESGTRGSSHAPVFCFLFFFFNVCVRRWSRQKRLKKKQSKMYSPKWDRARRMMNLRMSDGRVRKKWGPLLSGRKTLVDWREREAFAYFPFIRASKPHTPAAPSRQESLLGWR